MKIRYWNRVWRGRCFKYACYLPSASLGVIAQIHYLSSQRKREPTVRDAIYLAIDDYVYELVWTSSMLAVGPSLQLPLELCRRGRFSCMLRLTKLLYRQTTKSTPQRMRFFYRHCFACFLYVPPCADIIFSLFCRCCILNICPASMIPQHTPIGTYYLEQYSRWNHSSAAQSLNR